LLEVTVNEDLVIEVPITVDWALPTTESVELGAVEVVERNTLTIREHHDYGNEQAFVPDFSLALDCDLEVEVTDADTASVSAETDILNDYNLTRMTVLITAPVGSQLQVSGSLRATPSALNGSYPRDPSNDINWSLKEHGMTTYPPDVVTAFSASEATVNTSIKVQSAGLVSVFYGSGNAEFRTEENDYLGRFTGMIIVQVFGE
jgi:hypothetical protein